jgi:hypothetical protein
LHLGLVDDELISRFLQAIRLHEIACHCRRILDQDLLQLRPRQCLDSRGGHAVVHHRPVRTGAVVVDNGRLVEDDLVEVARLDVVIGIAVTKPPP